MITMAWVPVNWVSLMAWARACPKADVSTTGCGEDHAAVTVPPARAAAWNWPLSQLMPSVFRAIGGRVARGRPPLHRRNRRSVKLKKGRPSQPSLSCPLVGSLLLFPANDPVHQRFNLRIQNGLGHLVALSIRVAAE